MSVRYLPGLIVSLCLVSSSQAATWYVAPSGGDATTIQDGVNLATSGDVVLVAAGTYSGVGNIGVSFAGKSISVISESGAYFTFIDCQGAGRAFTINSGEGPGTVLEGFTIMNGSSTSGGAVYVENASPTIRFNVFKNNVASGNGGAIYVRSGTVTIYNNTLDDNAANSGGGMYFRGPATGQVYQNVVCGSTSGGGIKCTMGPTVTFTCNDIWNNHQGNGFCGIDGGSNIALDPLFCGIPGSGNFFVQQTSPLAPAYSPCGAGIGAFPVACQVTATSQTTWGMVKSLYR